MRRDEPAFPQPAASDNAGGIWMSSEKGLEYAGLTIRERFVMAAMQGLCADYGSVTLGLDQGVHANLAMVACRIADATLEEMEKK